MPGGRGERALLLLGIVTLAISLRPAVTSLGAVLGVVRDDLGISGWLAGVLTTLPVLSFAAVGLADPPADPPARACTAPRCSPWS